jgi:hypothetical protein
MTPQDLKDLLTKYGLSQRQFADAMSKIPDCGFARQNINAYCLGKKPITSRFRLAVDKFIRLYPAPD